MRKLNDNEKRPNIRVSGQIVERLRAIREEAKNKGEFITNIDILTKLLKIND